MRTELKSKELEPPFVVDSDGIFIARTTDRISNQKRFEKLVEQSNAYLDLLEFVAGIAEMPTAHSDALDNLIARAKVIVKNRVN
jgi:hypothetical protein